MPGQTDPILLTQTVLYRRAIVAYWELSSTINYGRKGAMRRNQSPRWCPPPLPPDTGMVLCCCVFYGKTKVICLTLGIYLDNCIQRRMQINRSPSTVPKLRANIAARN